ncbi:hypothetical protein JT06_15920 [Desulfobulbus sp. Tol-SR]|jgi:hypothetical protein|nr:hypothetical protein JT06_15920 [Desulfobulbus sp. Tol-SR]
MQIEEKHLTIAGFILTWLVGVFSGGIIYGRISAKVDKHDQVLFSPEGELRVLTYAAHDHMSESCNERRDIRISHVIAANEELKEDIQKLSDTVTREMKALSEALHQIALTQASDRSSDVARHRESDRRREAEK